MAVRMGCALLLTILLINCNVRLKRSNEVPGSSGALNAVRLLTYRHWYTRWQARRINLERGCDLSNVANGGLNCHRHVFLRRAREIGPLVKSLGTKGERRSISQERKSMLTRKEEEKKKG